MPPPLLHGSIQNIGVLIMKFLHILLFPTLAILLVVGCQSTRSVSGEADAADPDVDTTAQVYTNAIHVLVDGNDVGTLPRTIRVRRSFGTREISLWQAGEEIRKYEITITSTVEGDQTRMGFWGTETSDGETYDARTLPNEDEIYQIPYSNGPMKIEDHTYGLTLLIRE